MMTLLLVGAPLEHLMPEDFRDKPLPGPSPCDTILGVLASEDRFLNRAQDLHFLPLLSDRSDRVEAEGAYREAEQRFLQLLQNRTPENLYRLAQSYHLLVLRLLGSFGIHSTSDGFGDFMQELDLALPQAILAFDFNKLQHRDPRGPHRDLQKHLSRFIWACIQRFLNPRPQLVSPSGELLARNLSWISGPEAADSAAYFHVESFSKIRPPSRLLTETALNLPLPDGMSEGDFNRLEQLAAQTSLNQDSEQALDPMERLTRSEETEERKIILSAFIEYIGHKYQSNEKKMKAIQLLISVFWLESDPKVIHDVGLPTLELRFTRAAFAKAEANLRKLEEPTGYGRSQLSNIQRDLKQDWETFRKNWSSEANSGVINAQWMKALLAMHYQGKSFASIHKYLADEFGVRLSNGKLITILKSFGLVTNEEIEARELTEP